MLHRQSDQRHHAERCQALSEHGRIVKADACPCLAEAFGHMREPSVDWTDQARQTNQECDTRALPRRPGR